MSDDSVADGDDSVADGDSAADWPVALTGVTETVVTTLGPNGLWNVAALGVHAPDGDGDGTECPTARARTWGRTRTWRNFRERGEGVIQLTADPLAFAEAALTIREESEPVVDAADAWVRVTTERVDGGERGGTQWVDWRLHPQETRVLQEGVRSLDRATAAVVEATVAASRLDVPTYDTETLVDRLAYFDDVVATAGGERARAAFDVVDEATGWREL